MNEPVTGAPAGEAVICRFLQDCEQFSGADGLAYPREKGSAFYKGDIITLPRENGQVLAERQIIEILPGPSVPAADRVTTGETPVEMPEPEAVPEPPAEKPTAFWQLDPIYHRLILPEYEERRQSTKSLQCKEFPRSDLGNAQRLTLRFGRDLRYCYPFSTWFIWDGVRWARDEQGIIQEFGKETVLRLGDEAPMLALDTERTAAFKWAALSQNKAKIDNLIALSCSSIPISPEEMDTSPYLFNCKNGTLDLKTMEFRKHRQVDFITKLAGVEYNPSSECPLWLIHLKLVFNDDDEGTFITGFQEICGYSLIAGNPEQLMFILYGTGKNGKSVTLETLAKIWGDYAVNIAPETLMQRRNNEAPRGDIARIAGARLVTSSEGEDGARLAEAIVKQLTGGDRVTVRRLYEREFEFTPTGKIWMSTNHKPVILGTDYAIWRRIWLIPFNISIPDDKRDQNIKEKLAREGPGILNWCLAGLTRYFACGTLPQPARITEASQVYRDESDLLGDFITSRCTLQGEIKRGDLLAEYRNWCNLANEKAVSSRRLASLLRDRGIAERMTMGTRYWVGISLSGQMGIT